MTDQATAETTSRASLNSMDAERLAKAADAAEFLLGDLQELSGADDLLLCEWGIELARMAEPLIDRLRRLRAATDDAQEVSGQ